MTKSSQIVVLQTSESKVVYVVGPKGLTTYTVTTLLAYKTKDKFKGFIVKVKEKLKDDFRRRKVLVKNLFKNIL